MVFRSLVEELVALGGGHFCKTRSDTSGILVQLRPDRLLFWILNELVVLFFYTVVWFDMEDVPPGLWLSPVSSEIEGYLKEHNATVHYTAGLLIMRRISCYLRRNR